MTPTFADRRQASDTDRQDISRVSVIIANFNYARHVGKAIESALALDWPDVEVIVVDDGSDDGSVDVIARYEDRVTAVYQPNRTQRVARNVGFAMSTGDVVIHLDSDDVLYPELIRRVQPLWRRGISKVQVQMEIIDAEDRPIGIRFPRYRRPPTPEQMRSWVTSTSAHPTSPGSGNVYSREFLDRIFPLDGSCGPATDSACLIAAPLLGDVVTITEPLVGYRVHGTNTSNLLAKPGQFAKYVRRARQRFLYGQALIGNGAAPDERPLFRSRELLQMRVAAARLTPGAEGLPGDGRGRMLLDVLGSVFVPGPENLVHRTTIAAWCGLTLASPRRIAHRLIRMRYSRW